MQNLGKLKSWHGICLYKYRKSETSNYIKLTNFGR